MAINVSKLLPSSKKTTSAIIKADKFLAPKNFDSESSSIIKPSVNSNKRTFYSIRKKVIDINKLLGGFVEENKNQNAIVKRQIEDDKREKKEEKLEKPKEDKQRLGLKLPSLPGKGLFASIGDFITRTLTGFILYRLVDYGPQILRFLKIAAPVFDFVIDIGGKLLNGLVTFVDWGYKAVDATKGFIKNIAGEGGAKNFDKLASGLTTFMNYAVIAGMLAADSVMSDGGFGRGGVNKSGFDRSGRKVGKDIQKRYFSRYGKEQFLRRFGKENLENLGKSASRGALTKLGRNALVGTLGKGGTKALLRLAKPLLRNIPIIGGLAEFALSWALGDPVGKAAFRGIGSLLVGAVGTAIGGPIGAAIGGFVGGEVGGKLYEMFFENKKPAKNNKAPKRAGGGPVTRAGKLTGGPAKRNVKKTKVRRAVSVTPQKIKPGKDVGGQKKLETIYSKDDIKLIEEQNKKLGRTPFFGPIFSVAAKALVGDRPNKLDYKNVGMSLNNWISNTFKSDIGFAGGGEVDIKNLLSGDDMSNIIARSFEESVSSEVDDTINELMKKLGIKPGEKPAGVPGTPAPGPQDLINIQGGDADFWTLVAVASREDGEPQAWADVAQSIYNRLASGAYSGKTIKDLILGQMQYEPTWKYPKPGSTGKPNPEWYAIKDAASAGVAAGQSADAMKKVAAALLDPSLQKNARDFVQGRTDFRGYSVSGGVQRKSGDNYFGWYNNYTANKIGSVPNFGATASSGGAGPGISGPLGTGRIGAVDQFTSIAKKFGLQLTSDYRPGDSGYHGKNRARDYSNDSVGSGTPQQLAFAKHLVQNYGSSLTQLIYTPLGFGIANGKKVGLDYWGSSTNAQHYHHVHVALAKGGRVNRPTFAIVGEEGPEFVIDADSTAAIESTFPGFLDAINKAKYKDAVNVLRSYASYETETVYIEVPVEVPVPMESDYGESDGILPIAIGVNNNNDLFDNLNYG